jgi:hypothetical protein
MISGLSAYKMLWPYVALMAIPVSPPLFVGADRQCYQTTKIKLYLVTMHSETQMSEGELERAHTDQLHNSCRLEMSGN